MSKHDCDDEIRKNHWAMSGFRNDGDKWTCSCGKMFRHVSDEAEGGSWHPDYQIHDIANAPKDGTEIIGIYEDGAEVSLEWAEQRRCMLAGIGGGNGYYGAGWQDTDNHLIADEPKHWRDA